MQNKIRLFEYDTINPIQRPEFNSPILGKEWTDKISYGYTIQTVIDETIPEYQITLVGTDKPQRFQAGWKFIMYERSIVGGNEMPANSFSEHHLIVKDDFCQRVRMQNKTTFTHRITFGAASIIAQKATCDNFSITYKLQDVSIDIPRSFDLRATTRATIADNIREVQTRAYSYVENPDAKQNDKRDRNMREVSYRYDWIFRTQSDRSQWENFLLNKSPVDATQNSVPISLPLPLLQITGDSNTGTSVTEQRVNARTRVRVWRKPKRRPGDAPQYIDWSNSNFTNEYVRQNDNAIQYPNENWSTINFPFREQNNPAFSDFTPTSAIFSQYQMPSNNTLPPASRYCYVNEGLNYPNSPRTLDFKADCGGTFDNVSGTWINQIEYIYGIDVYFEQVPADPSNGRPSTIWGSNNTQLAPTQFPTTTSSFGYLLYSDGKYEQRSIDNDNFINNTSPSISLQFNIYPFQAANEIFTQSAQPYSLEKAINKAILCTRAYYSNQDIEYVIDPAWLPELRAVNTIETFYNEKNLWEVLISLGNYIHSIPFIRFTEDDKLMISFRKLGQVDKHVDNSNHLSLFNSQSISEYICTLDSTVSNLVQLGSEVEEIVQPTTNSSEFLVYNGSCVLQTRMPIIEIMSVRCGLKASPATTYDMTSAVVEQSIYRTLDTVPKSTSNEDAYFGVYKGTFLFYKNSTNVIDGLTYQAPFNQGASPTPMQGDFTIKKIIAVAAGIVQKGNININDAGNIRINDWFFVIRYRTKDTLRNVVHRTDLRKYFLNNKTEKLPILTQFNNQQDRFMDSNKFGLNAQGKLMKVGNTMYTKDEWNSNLSQIKQAGELYEIDGRLAYVARVTHTVWQNDVMSHVEYSIDYNHLSQIIGIPSEPRFYEISEMSNVDREVVPLDLIQLGTSISQTTQESPNPLSQSRLSGGGMIKMLDLMTFDGVFPKYAVMVIKSNNYRDAFLLPVACFTLMNTFCVEWDMVDNFSAGDMIKLNAFDEKVSFITDNLTSAVMKLLDDTSDSAYSSMLPIKYCDEFGRGDLFEFYILNTFDYSTIPMSSIPTLPEQVNNLNDYGWQTLPKVTLRDNDTQSPTYGTIDFQTFVKNLLFDKRNKDSTKLLNSFAISTTGKTIDTETGQIRDRNFIQDALHDTDGYMLDKDNREIIRINYNVSLITDSDRFILTNKTFENAQIINNADGSQTLRRKNIRIALFSEELNKFENGFVSRDTLIKDDLGNDVTVPFTKSTVQNLDTMECYGVFNISTNVFNNTTQMQREQVRAIGLYDVDDQDRSTGMIRIFTGRNVSDLLNDIPPVITSPDDERGKDYKFSDWFLSYVKQETFGRQ